MSVVVGRKLDLRFAACCAVCCERVWGISAPLALLARWRKRGERGPRRVEVFFSCHSDFSRSTLFVFFRTFLDFG